MKETAIAFMNNRLGDIEEEARANYIGVEKKDVEILKKNIILYKEAQTISKNLYKKTNMSMYIGFYEQHYLYSEKNTLLSIVLIDNNFDEALNIIGEMLRILEKMKNFLNTDNMMNIEERKRWIIKINDLYLNNQIDMENIRGEIFALGKNFEKARSCYNLAIMKGEDHIKKLEEHVKEELFETKHLDVVKANLKCRKGQYYYFLAIEMSKDDIEFCLENLLNARNCFKESRFFMVNAIENKNKIQDIDDKIKSVLKINLGFEKMCIRDRIK